MASFLSGLASLFTGEDLRKSEAERQRVLNTGFGQLQDFTTQGMNALNTNYTDALQQFTDLGPSAFTGMMPGAERGTQAYLDATGANGEEGLARANALFMSSTGPLAGITDAANKATARAMHGMGGGAGNIMDQIAKDTATRYGAGWQNYVSNLSPFLNYGGNIAGGLDRFGQGIAGAKAGIQTGLGDRIASMFGNLGQGAYGLSKDIGQSVYNQGMAPTVAAGNAVKLGTDLLAAFMNPAGFAAGSAGGLGSSLFNKYSGGLMGQNSRALVGG